MAQFFLPEFFPGVPSHDLLSIFHSDCYYENRKEKLKKNFYLYHVALLSNNQSKKMTYQKQWEKPRLEELSHRPRKGMCSCAFDFSFDSFMPHDPKCSCLSLMVTVLHVSEKTSYLFR